MRSLILGGARSGKSALAERWATASGLDVVYIATAERRDGEMDARIDTHRARRPAHWGCIETPLALADALRTHDRAHRCVLVDCLTLWLSNLLALDDAQRYAYERDALLDAVATARGELLLVSNEVGLGIVPMGELTRRFVDEAGRLHQALGDRCERVVFTAAGLPLFLKGTA
ncbi:bifunctional adenosylcobinamide kinase/adenosylcobinamide-phosphate guanylyltransferase [Cognatilysobacter bugurensis]|uniref:Bifunctional adenosylcobalamin biosynthesis protein n=1 Tax=Cognatilysobacter bugurensis TaxID=543356 RepID=A0A918W9P4_9GAMM|nr:bifunctional adenosylcobinamide kinase/adenosylcobinamide-phosphate guanylyltransferase [Lysobacter bugurensis]GHA80642.1 adenosylcobinamide kinase/adenosylcobinamide phosphate guanyltransferase [Lysobacter bugurensis]